MWKLIQSDCKMLVIKTVAFTFLLVQTQNVQGTSSAGTRPPLSKSTSTQSPTAIPKTSSKTSAPSPHTTFITPSHQVTSLNGTSSTLQSSSANTTYTSTSNRKPVSKVTTSPPTTRTRSTVKTMKPAPTTRPTASSTPGAVAITRTKIQQQLVASVFAVAAVSGILIASVAIMTIKLVERTRNKKDNRDTPLSLMEVERDVNGVRFSGRDGDQTYPLERYMEDEGDIHYGDEDEITTAF